MTSERMNCGLVEIQTQWSLDDLMDAHEALDVIEALEKELRDKPPTKS